MSLNFNDANCQTKSSKKTFGLCDDPPPANNPAYIDETNGTEWIAVVENESQQEIIFTAIDNCVEILRHDGKSKQRCDGMLTYNTTVIFVELKDRNAQGNAWVEDAIPQLNHLKIPIWLIGLKRNLPMLQINNIRNLNQLNREEWILSMMKQIMFYEFKEE